MSTTDREQLELLISRIADGEASKDDWAAFSTLAERQPAGEAWKELAAAQRDHAALSLAVGVALHGAERVDLPSRELAAAYLGQGAPATTHVRTWSRFGSFAGWGVAACLAVVMFNGGRFGQVPIMSGDMTGAGGMGGSGIGQNAAGILPASYTINNADDAVKAYLDVGKKQNAVIGELPQRLLVQSRPAENGQVEVIYVRQFVERAEVKDLMRFSQDESGRAVPVRLALPKAQSLPD